jgi:hypothetical protein
LWNRGYLEDRQRRSRPHPPPEVWERRGSFRPLMSDASSTGNAFEGNITPQIDPVGRLVGVSKPTLSKAISTGKLSATRREDGSWAIDPAELCRCVEANGHRFHSATGNGSRVETQDDTASAAAIEAQVEALRQVEALLRQELVESCIQPLLAIKDRREEAYYGRKGCGCKDLWVTCAASARGIPAQHT